MRYTYEFKKECIELYRQGIWPETPERIKEEAFRKTVRLWVRFEDSQGAAALQHKEKNRKWTPEEKFSLIAKVLAGNSVRGVASAAGIYDGTLRQWIQKYDTMGYFGLINDKRGRQDRTLKM